MKEMLKKLLIVSAVLGFISFANAEDVNSDLNDNAKEESIVNENQSAYPNSSYLDELEEDSTPPNYDIDDFEDESYEDEDPEA